jgi:hypothetical protein
MSLSSADALLGYYLGLGFVVLLGWAAVHPDRRLDAPATRRYLRWTTLVAIAGLVHPALALGARDIVGQVGHELPDEPGLHRALQRTTATVNVLTVVSAVVAAVVAVVALRAGA